MHYSCLQINDIPFLNGAVSNIPAARPAAAAPAAKTKPKQQRSKRATAQQKRSSPPTTARCDVTTPAVGPISSTPSVAAPPADDAAQPQHGSKPEAASCQALQRPAVKAPPPPQLLFLGLGVSACIRRRQSPLWYESNFITCKQNTQDSMYPHSYMTCDILAPPPVSSASVYFRHVAVDLQGRCRCNQEMWQTGRLALQGGLLAYFAVHEIALPLLHPL